MACMPLAIAARLHGKTLGLFWDADSRFADVQRKDKGTDCAYGAGLRFVMSPQFDVRTGYERFEFNGNKVGNLSAMLQFNF